MSKRLFHIDPGHEPSNAHVLLLRAGEKHSGFALTDPAGENLYKLAYHLHDEPGINALSALFGQYPELAGPFYKVLVSYEFPQTTLVPLQLYRHDETGSLLKTLYGVNGTSAVISESVADWQLYTVYAVPAELHTWVARNLPAAQYWHQYTVSMKQMAGAADAGKLLVDFRTDDFTVMAVAGNKLLLAQTYLYSTPEDVLYYLLKICQQAGLEQQEAELSLSGLVDRQSVLYKELYQYFIHIGFREPSWSMGNTEHPAHFFTVFNDLARCAL